MQFTTRQEDIQYNIKDKDRIIFLNSKLLREDREIVEKQVLSSSEKTVKKIIKFLLQLR
ncbi:MAG: hypothetical protein V8S33_10185 [Intestinibacter bartlettii]